MRTLPFSSVRTAFKPLSDSPNRRGACLARAKVRAPLPKPFGIMSALPATTKEDFVTVRTIRLLGRGALALALAALAVACVATLGCSRADKQVEQGLPAWTDEEGILAWAHVAADEFNERDYQAVADRFSDKGVTADQIKEGLEETQDAYGAFTGYGEASFLQGRARAARTPPSCRRPITRTERGSSASASSKTGRWPASTSWPTGRNPDAEDLGALRDPRRLEASRAGGRRRFPQRPPIPLPFR